MAGADVIVCGGGPAGSSAAWHLARAGARVTLLDRARFPREKPCAEYLSPEASRILDAMGVLERCERAGAAHLAGMAIRAPSGALATGSQLPTENDLIARFGVSRPTVRRAVQNLVSRGLVEIQRGRGTYVTRPKITQELTALSGFVEDMQALGRHPTARLLDKQLVAADKTVAQQLALPAGSLVVRIRRVRLADGEPVSFDETYLPRE
ncbi:MAG TPA: FAD-dependent oxidoreductase, partial [Gemmatimonadaceae bacterium]|nr:FAD-dependent oxidoreductase [Gemmatimonadaceae bacterium]